MQSVLTGEAQRFRYRWYSYCLYTLMQLAYAWLLISLHRRHGWSLATILLAGFFLAVVWDWWGTPKLFTVNGGVVTAHWLWGRKRRWRLEELQAPEARLLSSGAFYRRGYITVYQRNLRKAFAITFHLDDFSGLLELIEPGCSENLKPKHDPNSWWNRELF